MTDHCRLLAQVERLLDSVDAVIYLLDYTKLKTADEAEILQRLKEINPQLMARLSQRLFFVVNKADMIETSEGLDAEATKQYVADLITHQMQDESFQLKPDQVRPEWSRLSHHYLTISMSASCYSNYNGCVIFCQKRMQGCVQHEP